MGKNSERKPPMTTDSWALNISQWTTTFLASIHRWNGKNCDLSRPSVLELMKTSYVPEFAKEAGHDLLFALLQWGDAKPEKKRSSSAW